MKRFAGSVGTADIYYKNQLIASANTLTDSTITISTTQDEIRGGMYAPVQFTFTHDASIKVALTDIVWNRDYIMLQLGAAFSKDDQKAYTSEEHTLTAAGPLKVDHLPVAMQFGCGDSVCLVSYRLTTDDAWTNVEQDTPSKTIAANVPAGTYCVRYAYTNLGVMKAIVYSHIVPAEVRLVIRAPLFLGDACGSASASTSAGEVQYIIPRFKFDGNQTINGAMSSNSTMALNGTALAVNTGCGMEGGKLIEIAEVTDGTDFRTGAVGLALGDDAVTAQPVDLYVVYADGSTHKISAADFENDAAKIPTYLTPTSAFAITDGVLVWGAATTASIDLVGTTGVPALSVIIAAA